MTEKSLTASRIATCLRQARTSITRSACSLMISIVSAVWLALVFSAVVLWCLPDFIPKRKSKPLTSPTPRRRKLPHPYREGSEIFIEMPDGTIIPLEPMQASILCEEWVDVVKGAYVYEKTKLPDR